MLVTFWGTRGSIAKAGPSTVRFGGNTSCVSVRSDAGTQLVIDCGTGAHGLGQSLVAASTAAAMVVVGTHGHGPAMGALLGSVSNGLLHKAKVPVVVVPPVPTQPSAA